MQSRTYDPLKHHRRSTRLAGYDYASAGAYFVTICVRNQVPALGHLKPESESVVLRAAGRFASAQIEFLPTIYPQIQFDEWVIMPDHCHLILWLQAFEEHEVEKRTLGQIVGHWKHRVTCDFNEWRCENGKFQTVPLWQRGFFDRIIRDDEELNFVRRYIRENPQCAS